MRNLLLFFGISVTVAACHLGDGPSEGRTAKGNVHLGGTLRTVDTDLPATFEPSLLVSGTDQRAGTQVHVGLMRLDSETLLPVPGVAERVETDSAGLNYVFHLRQGVLFHPHECFGRHSREVSADDVRFSLEQLCRPEAPAFAQTLKGRVKGADAFHADSAEHVSGIRALDDYTVQITLTRPDQSFLFLLTLPSAGIISRRAYEECKRAVVGAGPFTLSSTVPSSITLIRNREYFAKDAFGNSLPYIDTLMIGRSTSKEESLKALLNGELDLVTGVYLESVKTLLEQNSAAFTGPDPRFVMQRTDDAASFEFYSIHTSRLLGFKENFLGHRDFSVVQMKR